MMWLLEKAVLEEMQSAVSSDVRPSVQDQIDYESKMDGRASQIIGNVSGGVARIPVQGLLTDAPNLMARFMGGGNTTYAEIRASLVAADQNPKVEKIILDVDSPGGMASAEWVETMDALAAVSKPTEAIIGSVGASAAYGIASQTDTISAKNRMSRIGSIGVMATVRVSENVVKVASSNAPKKVPDVTTEEGQALVRENLDQIEKIFIDAIASGRGVSVEEVTSNFGRGGTVLASEAVDKGMIDTIVSHTTSNNTASGGIKTEAQTMDLNKLKIEHPDVFAAAKLEGVTAERDRVEAHMIMGQTSGAMDTACEAIKDGSEMTQSLQAKYMAAGMNKSNVEARDEDDKDLDAKAPKVPSSQDSDEDEVTAALEKLGTLEA